MTWADIRREAREDLHREFAIPATYTPPEGGTPVGVTVRYHSRLVKQGDLDSTGFTEIAENVTQIVFLQSEVSPERSGTVTIEYGSKTFVFTIAYVVPPDDDTIIAAEVSLDLTP